MPFPQKALTTLFFISLVILQACESSSTQREAFTLRGETMGTSYSVKIVLSQNKTILDTLSNEIETTLESINNSLSDWKSDSEISRFNQNTSTQFQAISNHFYQVMHEAMIINKQSLGQFDVTLSPLINLWGFGPQTNASQPTPSIINEILNKVDQSALLTLKDNPPSLKKQQADVSLNLSSIAKGYAIDQIAAVLRQHHIQNYIVEIGGDLVTNGMNLNEQAWRIAIEKPNDLGQSVQAIIPLHSQAIATSGDYRNFYRQDNKRLSHILNPKTGYPITHNLASVTVIESSAMRADGLATALMVMGEKEGLILANKLDIAVYFITRHDLSYKTSKSNAFKDLYPNI